MEKLNLTPQERRAVAGVGLIVFVFLNIWLVWPHFSDRNRIQQARHQAELTLGRYEKEVSRLKLYEAKVRSLESQGQSVPTEDQDFDLPTIVLTQARISNVQINNSQDARSGNTQTNQFFDERARRISYSADTEELVRFLTSLTTTNSLIRVKDLMVRPDPPNNPSRLVGDITLVASYQRKAPLKSAAVTTTAAIKPPANAPSKPATKVAATATKTNIADQHGLPSKQSAGPNLTTNKPLTVSSTNKAVIPKRKPIDTSLPKS